MDARWVALALGAVVACRSGTSPVPEARADEPTAPAAGGVAVLELFTSEGCSSCPPADAALADLAQSNARSVYALAFHVDYWDELGWPDRFASPASTARQRAYARSFGARGVYTPQLVVDGAEELTGSDRPGANAAIARALARPAGAVLSVHVRATGPRTLTADYEVRGAPRGTLLNVAVVERLATTSVRAGENAGKTLRHVNVVRSFQTSPLGSPQGSVPLTFPAALRREDAEVIAFVQRDFAEGSGTILGAARATLPAP